MKFLFLSGAGDGNGLALRLKDNGHEVAVWIRERRTRLNYDGLLKKVTKWENFLDKETIVVFDSSGGGKTADRLRARGHHVFAGSAFADQLELDRATGFALMDQVGIKIPHSETFFSWEEGKTYAAKQKGRLVFKPSGEIAKGNGITSYVASDPEDMVDMLTYFGSLTTKSPEFELQEFITDGVAISTEGWFNGEEFLTPFNHTVERKQSMNDNLGPSGGCAGNAVWKVDRMNHIIDEGIARMTPVLKEYSYVGPIDLNTIVNNEGVWALEFTPRFGYDAMPAFLELYEGDIGELIAKLAMGEKPKEMVLKSGFASGLRVTVPPYPSEEFVPSPGVPIRGFTRSDRSHLYFYDVQLDRENNLTTTPAYGAVVCITGHGASIDTAFEPVYQVAKGAKIPEKQYRTDMVKVLEGDYHKWHSVVSMRNSQHQEVGAK